MFIIEEQAGPCKDFPVAQPNQKKKKKKKKK